MFGLVLSIPRPSHQIRRPLQTREGSDGPQPTPDPLHKIAWERRRVPSDVQTLRSPTVTTPSVSFCYHNSYPYKATHNGTVTALITLSSPLPFPFGSAGEASVSKALASWESLELRRLEGFESDL